VRAVALLTLCASIIRSTYWHMSATLIVEVWIRNLLSIKSRRVRRRRDLKELLPYHRRVWTIFYTHTFYFFSKFCYLLVQSFLVSKDFFSTRNGLFLQVLPIPKIPFPLLDQATLLWTAMEAIREVMRVAHPVGHRQNTRRHHLGHPAKAVHLPLIKVCLSIVVYNPLQQ